MLRTYILYLLSTQRFEFWHPFVAQTPASGPSCDRSASELPEMTQFGPNGHKTDMLRSSEASKVKIQLNSGLAFVYNTGMFVLTRMPDLTSYLSSSSSHILHSETCQTWHGCVRDSVRPLHWQSERTCRKGCSKPKIARRFQFRHPFVAQISRFCAIH